MNRHWLFHAHHSDVPILSYPPRWQCCLATGWRHEASSTILFSHLSHFMATLQKNTVLKERWILFTISLQHPQQRSIKLLRSNSKIQQETRLTRPLMREIEQIVISKQHYPGSQVQTTTWRIKCKDVLLPARRGDQHRISSSSSRGVSSSSVTTTENETAYRNVPRETDPKDRPIENESGSNDLSAKNSQWGPDSKNQLPSIPFPCSALWDHVSNEHLLLERKHQQVFRDKGENESSKTQCSLIFPIYLSSLTRAGS